MWECPDADPHGDRASSIEIEHGLAVQLIEAPEPHVGVYEVDASALVVLVHAYHNKTK